MSFSDKSQKSEEAYAAARQSTSSSSRRVMWKLSDNEETFDSIVSYRQVPVRKGIIVVNSAKMSNNGAQLRRKSTEAWTHLFNLIKRNKLAENLSHSSLALRYKPSRESLKYKRTSKDQKEKEQLRGKLIVTDVRMEACNFPPQQSAVVQEVPPKFAQRIHTNCNDSDSSDCTDMPKIAVATANANALGAVGASTATAVTMGRSSRLDRANLHAGRISTTSANSSIDAMLPRVDTPTYLSPVRQTRRRVHYANIPNNQTDPLNNSTLKLSAGVSAATTNATSTLRQRQFELHRFRLLVEQRRLELLDLKIVREREEAVRQQILFQKDLEFKASQFKQVNDDVSNI